MSQTAGVGPARGWHQADVEADGDREIERYVFERMHSAIGAPRADSKLLVVTNIWPHETDPTYGIFVKRQVDSLITRGIACDVLFIRGYLTPRAYLSTASLLARMSIAQTPRYRLVHAHGGEAGAVARVYLRAPLVVTYYGSDLLGIRRGRDSVTPLNRFRRQVVRQSARAATATVTQSSEMERALPAAARARNLVIPNGIDRSIFHPIDRVEARAELGWPDSSPVCLFAGDPSLPVKRFWLAAAACRYAEDQVGSLRLERIWGIAPDRMPLALNAADCLLLTSSAEGSPNIVKEAVMCGLPVVATRVGDVEDILRGVLPSWVCDDSPAGLGRALVDCLSRRERSNGWTVGERLSLDSVAARLERLYEEVAPGLVGSQVGRDYRSSLTCD
jgi:teichuronic acid biosynthesis glycosyltransferase TuaC